MMHGGCLCGEIRYTADGVPFHETNCHCTTCRRACGAPFVAWFSIARAGYRLTRGTPTRFRSSDGASRTFCGRCGTALTFEADGLPDEIDITVCSLDDPARVPPRSHIWMRSRLEWVRLADGLPEFTEAR